VARHARVLNAPNAFSEILQRDGSLPGDINLQQGEKTTFNRRRDRVHNDLTKAGVATKIPL